MKDRIAIFLSVAAILLSLAVNPATQTIISNNAADMANHIVMVADSTTARTVTNLFTFNRGTTLAPFAVGNAGATTVTNLDADLLDAQQGSFYLNATNLNAGTVASARESTTITNFLVPTGAILYFNNTTATGCPTGWTEFTGARGAYISGLVNGGTKNTLVGTALTDQENRAAGVHGHGVTDPGHFHTFQYTNGSTGAGGNAYSDVTNNTTNENTDTKTTGLTINNSAGVAGTNAPYIQLLVCQKS